MDLEPLANNSSGEVSSREFTQLFKARLGSLFPRAMQVVATLGPMHSFSIANVIHLGLQKGNVDTIVEALEAWCELFHKAPDPITAHVDTKLYFDILYGQYFMTPGDTLNGMGPFAVAKDYGQPRLWIPGSF